MSAPSPSPSSPPPPSPPSNSNTQPNPDPDPNPLTTVTTSGATKKPQPVPWNHPETIYLIQTYQEKWYTLKRGQLKANQWDEIALTVAARCGYNFSHHPPKSPIQCRHKMEKLRKRFRAEKQRFGPRSPWHYYQLMDSLDRGPMPTIAARPLALYPFSPNGAPNSDHSEPINVDYDEDDEEGKRYSKSRSINYILRRPSLVNRFAGSGETFSGFMQNSLRKRRLEEEEEEQEEEEEEEDGERGRGRNVAFELAAEIRGFAKSVMRVERRKMEMIREIEKYRMDMENKRIEMIMDSQKKVIDTIQKAFGLLPENLKSEQEV